MEESKFETAYKKLQVKKFSRNFDEATRILELGRRGIMEPNDTEVLVKVHYVGVNALDLDVMAGKHYLYSKEYLPFDFGFEALVEIVKIGGSSRISTALYNLGLTVGSAALYVGEKAYTEYLYLTEIDVRFSGKLLSIPSLNPDYLAFGISGLTASICLEEVAKLKAGEKIAVTSAGGGLGHLVVQWAMIHGAHVIGLTTTPEKANMLSSLKCSQILNCKTRDVDFMFKELFPKPLDVVWETKGGEMYKILFQHLGVGGRMVSLGATGDLFSGKKSDKSIMNFYSKIQLMSQDVMGFDIFSHRGLFPEYVDRQVNLYLNDKYKPILDFGERTLDGPFQGLEDVGRALNWFFSGNNVGKVIVKISKD